MRVLLEDLVPHHGGFFSVRYAVAGVSALVRANYIGSVVYKPDNAANVTQTGVDPLSTVTQSGSFNTATVTQN